MYVCMIAVRLAAQLKLSMKLIFEMIYIVCCTLLLILSCYPLVGILVL